MHKLLGFTGVFLAVLPNVSFAQSQSSYAYNQQLVSTDHSTIDGILFVVLLGLLLAPVYIYFNRVKYDAERKRKALQHFSPAVQNIILTMASAAKTDGEVAESEVVKIQQTVEAMTDRRMSRNDVQKIVKMVSEDFRVRDIQGVVTGISTDEKRDLLLALFGVIAADGKLRKAEREYSRKLCKGLQISQPLFDATWIDYFEQNPHRLTVE